MTNSIRRWWASGEPYIWLNAGAVALSVILVVGLVLLIAVRGLGHFWPADVYQLRYQSADGTVQMMLGEIVDRENVAITQLAEDERRQVGEKQPTIERLLLKTGNRDFSGLDFNWILAAGVQEQKAVEKLLLVERREWGDFYGYFSGLKKNGETVSLTNGDRDAWQALQTEIEASVDVFRQIRHIEKDLIGAINYSMERLRLEQRGLQLKNILTSEAQEQLDLQRQALQVEYEDYTGKLAVLYAELNQTVMLAEIASGDKVEIPLSKIVRAYRPNAMSVFDKIGFYFAKLWEFMSDEPREANTEGGIFPAIFGTVMMVIVMAILVTPFGVIAAVYLREYAKQGPLTRLIRIAVNNLAGVPSVVYGVFGLGFFVYFLGGNIDRLFFPEALPAPTFGTPGLMWASLTLAILTVPVVIVSTEEGLSRVPRSIREGSLALGATKAETLWLTVLPMTASAMMTGLILAVARAAGEVAPLMLVGVVKLAPTLPFDGNFPYLHLDRKFMHLGFHIYDVGFQSPNVEAARPLVYATALLLVLLIIILNLAAIRIRNRLREKYRAAEQ